MLILTMAQVQNGFSTAFEALPEPYKNDSCLEFYVEDGTLFAKPVKGQEYALGNEVWFFDLHDEQWWNCKEKDQEVSLSAH